MEKQIKYYAGIGSRQTPMEILKLMTATARKLEAHGYVLRTGGAEGADTAFALGAKNVEIYRPEQADGEALSLASTLHPAWGRCSDYARRLHARNCYQVLGRDLRTPSEFVICWTPDSCVSAATRSIHTGGTATAIVLAERSGIRVYNLHIPSHLALCRDWITKK